MEQRLALSHVQAFPQIDAQLDLDTGALTVAGTAPGDSITVGSAYVAKHASGASGTGVRVVFDGVTRQFDPGVVKGVTVNLGAGTHTVAIISTLATAPITVQNTAGGTDNVTVGDSSPGVGTTAVAGPVTVQNQGGTVNLTVNDMSDTSPQTATVSASAVTLGSATVRWTGPLATLLLEGDAGGNTYNIASTAPGTAVNVECGAGHDIINVRATSGPLIIENQHAGGIDAVNVGSLAPSLGGTLAGIQGAVNLTNSGGAGGHTDLTLDDSGDTTGRTAAVTESGATGLSPASISYNSALSSLALFGGSGGNTFNVQGTAPKAPTTLHSGAGHDIVNIRATSGPLYVTNTHGGNTDSVTIGSQAPSLGGTLAGIQGPVNVSDSSGTTTLTIDDSGDTTGRAAFLDGSNLTGMAPAPITYKAISGLNLYGGSGGNTFNLLNTTPNTPVKLYCGANGDVVNIRATQSAVNVEENHSGGRDAVNVGSLAPSLGGTMCGIQGAVNVSNSGGTTSLTLDDSGDSVGRAVTVTAQGVSGMSPAPVSYDGSLSHLSLYGGSGGNSVNYYNTGTVPTSYHGAMGGNDWINVAATGTLLAVDGSAGGVHVNPADGNPYDYNMSLQIAVDSSQPQDDNWSCGPNSASRVLRAYGYNVSYKQVEQQTQDNDFLSKLTLGSAVNTLRDVMRRWKPDTTAESGTSFDHVLQQLLQGKPVVALISLGSQIRLSAPESSAAEGGILGAIFGPVGAIFGAVNGATSPLNFPQLHYIVLNGVDIASQTLSYVDTDGSSASMSFAQFQAEWNWTADSASMPILKTRGASPRSIIS